MTNELYELPKIVFLFQLHMEQKEKITTNQFTCTGYISVYQIPLYKYVHVGELQIHTQYIVNTDKLDNKLHYKTQSQ